MHVVPTTDLTRGIYRKLYSGMRTGRRINSVSVDAALLFWHLHTVADDFGNLMGDPDLVRTEAAPRRREWDDAKVEQLITELASTNRPLISTYQHNGSRYIHIHDFEVNQPAGKNGKRIQKHPLFMEPDEVNQGESKGIQIDPGESKGIQIDPGESKGIQIDPDLPGKSCPPMPMPMPKTMPRPTPSKSDSQPVRASIIETFERWLSLPTSSINWTPLIAWLSRVESEDGLDLAARCVSHAIQSPQAKPQSMTGGIRYVQAIYERCRHHGCEPGEFGDNGESPAAKAKQVEENIAKAIAGGNAIYEEEQRKKRAKQK